jgi:hypothetical protein
MAIETTISSEELVVINGPTEIQLSVDFGQQGTRGTYVFVSPGNPNTALVGQSPNPKDLCINYLTTDSHYSYVYQYNAALDGTYQWDPIIKLNPGIYNKNWSGSFVSGNKTFNIPIGTITDLTTAQSLTASNFSVQFNIQGTNPIASSVSIGAPFTESGTTDYVLPLTFHGVEYSGGTWSALTGTKTVQIGISIVV